MAEPAPAEPPSPPETWRRRLRSIQAAAIGGIVAGIGWMLVLRTLLDLPAIEASDAEIEAYYAALDGDGALWWLQVLVFATIGFLWFIGVIRQRVGAAHPLLFGTVFFGGGMLVAALLFVGISAALAPTVLVVETDRAIDPDMATMMRVFGRNILGVITPRIASLFVFSMATLALRTRALPRWLIGISYLTGVAMFLNATYAASNAFVFPGWVVFVSAYLLISRRDGSATDRTA